jgi:hypothetical protein
LVQELNGEGVFFWIFRVVEWMSSLVELVEEGESGHGEDRITQRFGDGTLVNYMSDKRLDVFVSA